MFSSMNTNNINQQMGSQMMQVSKEAKKTQEKMQILEARINLLQRK
jgi:hypothetical protein